ncbi:MAG: hypothetical protein ACD_3C00205G0002 [uncultured bacterium (gcode 4)]|uniref:adenine phosphoribosyltransferase n=1 Tax=uncultured bacterium (gcode 4) TaxID=1234023 RepID=K2GB87_9BACT|nr:MAG: hypothetical protein ACD_3C00205G0002 [uncultured bacterium (gcode 4)]
MKNSRLMDLLNNYRSLELKAHVSLDDVMNKVTQEVAELVEAIVNWDIPEMKKEAGDAIVNILSASAAAWAEISDMKWSFDGEFVPLSFEKLFMNLWKWNQEIQALRWRYSRDVWCVGSIKDATVDFVENILRYVDKEVNLSDVVAVNSLKFSNRTDAYKAKFDIYDFVDNYSDFPKEWIEFKDISPILRSQEAMKYVCFELAEKCKEADIIAGLDARWFLFWVEVAKILGKPFVMIRKKGKLPGETVWVDYSLEYWENEIEIQKNALEKWQKVALIDDLLATWWTMLAAAGLVEKLWWIINNISCVISLDDEALKSSEARISLGKYDVWSVMKY